MKLVEQHIIKSNHKFYNELDNLCFLSKNLYNTALYEIRQHFFNSKENNELKSYLNFYDVDRLLKERNDLNYRSLPTQTSQQVLRLVDQNFKSFFNLLKMKQLKTYSEKIKIPGYLDSEKGRQILIYTSQNLSKNHLNEGIIKVPKTKIQFKTKVEPKSVKQVRFIPRNNYIVMEVVYEATNKDLKKSNGKYLSIDLGINNLATCVNSETLESFIVNGKPVKSINQYYNKEKSRLQSATEKSQKRKTSKNLNKLTLKRNNKIKNYFHKASKYIVNQAVNNSLNSIVIGLNKEWKQDTNIGKKNNQNFVNIPHSSLVQMIVYKAAMKGIKVYLQEESYTSKASALDLDVVPEFGKLPVDWKPSGTRIKRGLFETKNGMLLNADVNGSLNILRKFLLKNDKETNEKFERTLFERTLVGRGSATDPAKICLR